MDITNAPLGHLEKPMQFRWCMVFIAAALFFECYLGIRFQISLQNISWEWIKTHIDLTESVLIVFSYTFTFAVLIPGIGFTGSVFFSEIIFSVNYWIELHIFKVKDSTLGRYRELGRFYTIHKLKKKALKERNSPMYQEAVKCERDARERSFLRYICQSIIALSAIDWFVSNSTSPTVARSFNTWINSLPFYWETLAVLVILVFGLIIFGIAFEKHDLDRYTLVEKHELEDANNVPNTDIQVAARISREKRCQESFSGN